ncbi:pyridoxal-5'-phosphate-dependent protein subunit beta [Halorubrum ezzemoulense]|uniref:Pyridoxal-5'-phosphate-dependent protein subunit beta n=1 Tax=Halorubrum ezzemoulense TaxID=337243 RepID=A0A256J281_HALEZ|nr:PLP-dependent cysteine synthase family protein [Halorubrum ezzemoulense]OYR62901.1 pyridoxal-5'-phosphate-dependent protein subunit beta [Halorubrum ezzemoulense]
MASRNDLNTLEAIGETPMVDLPSLRPKEGASISVKWEGANPTGSLKDRMARAIVEAARNRGDIEPGDPVVEFTGGSTGTSLAFVCAVLGHPFHVVTADCVADEKIASMRALGAQVKLVETPDGTAYDGMFDDLREEALRVRDQIGAYFTNQFENHDQLNGYEAFGNEILNQRPDVDEFVMIVGTGGCAMGTARALREADADVRISVVEPAESPVLTEGTTGEHSVQGTAIVGSPPLVDDDAYDRVYTIPNEDGIECVREIAREEGMLVGTSTGMNVTAAQRIAANRDPDATVVTVACDTGLKYLSGGLYEGLEESTFCLC